MVSFQCDGCAEVVKKPKLEKHYSMCHASVTCLDCNTTFAGIAQFKAHTTCISEAEKYQKGLYKGPKGQQQQQNGQQRNGANGWSGGQNASTVPIEAPLPKTNGTHAGANGDASDGAKDAAVSVTPAKGKEDKKDKKKDKKRKAGAVDGGGSAQAAGAQAEEEPRKKKAKTENGVAPTTSPSALADVGADVEAASSIKDKKKRQEGEKGQEIQRGSSRPGGDCWSFNLCTRICRSAVRR